MLEYFPPQALQNILYTSHENFTVVESAVAKMAKSKATQANKW